VTPWQPPTEGPGAKQKGRLMEFVVLILWWAIPIVLIGYLVRVVQTIILGMRSMNSQLERIAAAVEELAESERRRAS
jgi:hypothetical protein